MVNGEWRMASGARLLKAATVASLIKIRRRPPSFAIHHSPHTIHHFSSLAESVHYPNQCIF
jgi:hypothetical protein